MKRLLKNQKGQGTTEYIVILALAVAIAIGIFWKPINGILQSKVNTMGQQIATAGN